MIDCGVRNIRSALRFIGEALVLHSPAKTKKKERERERKEERKKKEEDSTIFE